MENVTKKCPGCGASINFDPSLETAVCCYCDSKVYVLQTPVESETFAPFIDYTPPVKRRMSKLGKGILITLAAVGFIFTSIFVLIIIYAIMTETTEFDMIAYSDNPVHGTYVRVPDAKETHSFAPGEAFMFDEFEITIGDGYEWRVVEMMSESRLNGLDALRVPVTITNKSDETRGVWDLSFSYIVYGPEGISVSFSTVASVFWDDDNIASAENMRSGATVSDKYIHFMYDGDGYYYITFNTWNETWEVKIYIEK